MFDYVLMPSGVWARARGSKGVEGRGRLEGRVCEGFSFEGTASSPSPDVRRRRGGGVRKGDSSRTSNPAFHSLSKFELFCFQVRAVGIGGELKRRGVSDAFGWFVLAWLSPSLPPLST